MIDPLNMSILIVDDMQIMCKTIYNMLKILKIGKNFTYAYNGQEAVNILQKQEFDFAIIDCNMPVMTGIELISYIRSDKKLRDMPVIMITAETDREVVADVAESGIDSYILKPITLNSLSLRLNAVLEKLNNPPPMIYHLKRARDFEEAGNIDDAVAEVLLAQKADQKSSRPYRTLGTLFLKKNDLESAEKFLLQAAKMNRLDVQAFYILSEIYLQKNEVEKASDFIDKAMRINPRHSEKAIELAKILVENGSIQKAEKIFNKAIDLSQDPSVLQEEISDFCVKHKAYSYVISLIESIMLKKQYNISPKLLLNLGIAYNELEQYVLAVNHLIEAEKKDNSNIKIKLQLSRAYIAINKKFAAEKVLKSASALSPNEEDAEEIKELLKKCL
ncbi:MAG: response regulator [Desulfobacterales bacterium]|nr:response regulator [Desulfobacterales bacterium]